MDHKWNADEFFTMVTPFRSLFQHLVEPTLYSDEQVRYFIQYWTHKWQFQLTDDIEELIIKEAGGILLLAKAVIRLGKTYSMQTRAELFQALRSHQDYKLQIQLFVNRLTKTQQTILSNPNSLTDREREAAHLRAMGILRLTAQGYRIRSLSVERFIHPEILSDVLYQTVNDQVRLSKTEDILLRLFVDHEGQTIPREAVANLLHNNIPNSPSDWAIDQAISRLRKKLSTTNLAASATIITKKKIGFLFQRL